MRKYSVNGVLDVEQLIKDDFLTFTCRVLRKDGVVDLQEVYINSSLTCEVSAVTLRRRLFCLSAVSIESASQFSFLSSKPCYFPLRPSFEFMVHQGKPTISNLVLSPLFCVSSVSSRGSSRKLGQEQKKKGMTGDSSENFLTEIREENLVQNIETEPLMALEEKLGERDSQLAILQDYGEEESAKLQEQLRRKRKEIAELERELNDREQDYIKLQRDLCETKEKLTKCESLLTTREWLISRDEIEIMHEKFLGEGSYGKVFKGRYRGFVIAVKELKCLSTSRERDLFEREMDIASRCRHPCLLQFIGATQDEKTPLFVTELMESSLRKLLEKRQLSEKEIVVISLDVAHALNYLHQRKPKAIVHRDVSSANVLLWKQNGQWRGKLGDYGTAKFLQAIMTVAPGAIIYGAPEVGSPHHQTVKIDVYSFGVLLCEMCTRKMPVLENREEQVRLVSNKEFSVLILWCIEEDPMMRPSMEEVIKELEQIKDID
ncbi:unnamed protein product [Porites evermanni]|uniref:Protein kinase domain-containing protein n=1 Tax=Porites evermanni TaxID=104178 RepID=A0ABN8SDA8_9CNID|nr:unnamed protein product [Porites evermanni]